MGQKDGYRMSEKNAMGETLGSGFNNTLTSGHDGFNRANNQLFENTDSNLNTQFKEGTASPDAQKGLNFVQHNRRTNGGSPTETAPFVGLSGSQGDISPENEALIKQYQLAQRPNTTGGATKPGKAKEAENRILHQKRASQPSNVT